jgi:hypothetical protein
MLGSQILDFLKNLARTNTLAQFAAMKKITQSEALPRFSNIRLILRTWQGKHSSLIRYNEGKKIE